MGFKVADGDHGAIVSCVEPSMGLHQQYGLRQGDVIVELNRHTPVTSAADFTAKVTQLENDLDRPIAAWEFVVNRGGQKVTLAPKPAWVACGVVSFERCGSVVNKAN
jgi:S1-C subfamily serine protease